MTKFLAGLVACFVAFSGFYALASRNSSGTMAAANGPYIAGTTISVSQVNNRFADIENEITDSLSRSGKGGMTAALKGADGTVAAPAFSFTNEPSSGLYRIGAGDLGWAISGSKKLELNATGLGIGATPGARLDVEGTFAAGKGVLYLKGVGDHGGLVLDTDTPLTKEASLHFYKGGVFKAEVYVPANSDDLRVFSGAADRLIVNASGVTIGASGTPISGSFRGTVTWNPANQGANSCAETTITVTGASASGECSMREGGTLGGAGMTYMCRASVDSCIIRACNVSTVSQAVSQGTYSCRVTNP